MLSHPKSTLIYFFTVNLKSVLLHNSSESLVCGNTEVWPTTQTPKSWSCSSGRCVSVSPTLCERSSWHWSMINDHDSLLSYRADSTTHPTEDCCLLLVQSHSYRRSYRVKGNTLKQFYIEALFFNIWHSTNHGSINAQAHERHQMVFPGLIQLM